MATAARWSVEQVLKLAPDAGSVRAARALATPRRWSDLGSNDSLVWGRCQGSAREPYQVTVDLMLGSGHAGRADPAFRCTCPSRKFPCKHGLALLLLWAGGNGSVSDAAVADFAAAWSSERIERAAKAEARRQARVESPPDPEAQARRLAERRSLMSAGLDDFERWLFDMVRQGLAAARRQPFAYWDNAAARLVDAQVPGLADRVRFMAGDVHSRPDWADHLLAEAGRWWLAVRAWRRWDDLPEEVAGDLRTVLGWSRRTDEVLDGVRVADRWHVVGLRQDEDERLLSQRTWLRGERTGRMVQVLDFAAAGGTLAVAQVLGSIVEAELALYPGSPPPRARFTGDERVVGTAPGLAGATTVEAALDQAAAYLAANPWHHRVPMLLGQVAAVAGPAPKVVDAGGDSLPVAAEPRLWSLLALSGGAAADVFGEWYGDRLHLSSAVVDGALVAL
ncbi:MAG: SWIM zinc finger family protein [Acidimicrobiia bacterium]